MVFAIDNIGVSNNFLSWRQYQSKFLVLNEELESIRINNSSWFRFYSVDGYCEQNVCLGTNTEVHCRLFFTLLLSYRKLFGWIINLVTFFLAINLRLYFFSQSFNNDLVEIVANTFVPCVTFEFRNSWSETYNWNLVAANSWNPFIWWEHIWTTVSWEPNC